MKTNTVKKLIACVLAAMLCLSAGYVLAESSSNVTVEAPASDTSPALYVAQKTASSVVGVITSEETWSRQTGETSSTAITQGSGVCIREGGYVLTNNHVVADGSSYQVLMPSGEKANATLVGADSSTDIAVLKVEEPYASQLVPVEIGSSSDLMVGATVIAIGNPGGSVLANTVTQGIVSGLERDVSASRSATRSIAYIQHSAAINSGNSGGGLFDFQGRLVGINTLKYYGSSYSSVSFESLGFAIPVDTANAIATQLIDNGKVIRPAMGVTVYDWEGPDEPMSSYPPMSSCIMTITEGSPAEAAGFQQYDFIYSIDGVRVTCYRELTAEMDKHQAGDTVEVKVVRYKNINVTMNNSSSSQYDPFGSGDSSNNNGGGYYSTQGGFEYVTLNVTLAILDK